MEVSEEQAIDDKGLLAWLNAAITRREEAARDASRVYGPRWVRPVGTDMVRISDDDIWFQALSDEIAEHVVYNSPESVLRRCAADRKLIAAHPTTREVITVKPDGTHGFGCAVCHYDHYVEGRGWCDTLLALAEGYGWTENER